MEKPLKGTDYPPGPDRATLYQKLALDNWKQAIGEQKRKDRNQQDDVPKDTPDIVSDS